MWDLHQPDFFFWLVPCSLEKKKKKKKTHNFYLQHYCGGALHALVYRANVVMVITMNAKTDVKLDSRP